MLIICSLDFFAESEIRKTLPRTHLPTGLVQLCICVIAAIEDVAASTRTRSTHQPPIRSQLRTPNAYLFSLVVPRLTPAIHSKEMYSQ